MPLPLDLILVRHGQSEGNVVISKARKGDSSLFTDDFRNRHSSTYRLTDIGIEQAKVAGDWLKTNFKPPIFGRYLTSEYTRAMETAALLDLPDAQWQVDFFLRERDWGDLDGLSFDEQKAIFARNLKMFDTEPFYWTPPNGESLVNVCSGRIMWVLQGLKDYSDSSAVVVCHEEVVWSFRILLERLRQADFAEKFQQKNDPEDKMVNCQIFHYTRRNPETGAVSPFINWVRTVDPVDKSFETDWRELFPKIARFSNEDLLEIVEKTPRTINNI
jgi:NAD+ kinase